MDQTRARPRPPPCGPRPLPCRAGAGTRVPDEPEMSRAASQIALCLWPPVRWHLRRKKKLASVHSVAYVWSASAARSRLASACVKSPAVSSRSPSAIQARIRIDRRAKLRLSGRCVAPVFLAKRRQPHVILGVPRRKLRRACYRGFGIAAKQMVRPRQTHRPVAPRGQRREASEPRQSPQRNGYRHAKSGRTRLTIRRAQR